MRFRILEIDLKRLLPEEPAHGNPPRSLAAGLAFCGEDETLPEGVRIFTSSLPGVFVFVVVVVVAVVVWLQECTWS